MSGQTETPATNRRTFLWATAGSLLAAAANGPPAIADPSRLVAFEDVNVLPMNGARILPHQVVVVQGDRIVEIGSVGQVGVPVDAQRVEGRGRYLMPGIAEMHAHVPGPDDPARDPIMELYVLTGATTIRAMNGPPDQLDLRRQILQGEILGPTLFAVGPPFDGHNTGDPDDARRKVHQYHAAGFDVLKIYSGLTRAQYDAIMGAARSLRMRVAGHVPPAVGVRHAIASGQSIEHLDGYVEAIGGDRHRIADLVRLTREAGIWNTPTMDVWKTLLGLRDAVLLHRDRPEIRYLPPHAITEWIAAVPKLRRRSFGREALERLGLRATPEEIATLRDQLLRALHEGGARLLLGADSPQVFSVPGFSLAHEAKAMVAAGVPTQAVLHAATRNAAEYFDQLHEFGTVEVGKRADLILLDDDPRADIANLHRQAGVMVRGQWLSAAEIARRLETIAGRWSGGPGARPR
jgi:hypothetical protein